MSFASDWKEAFRQDGPDQLTTRAVGIALAQYADDDTGEASPKQSTLAQDLASTRQTISKHISVLEESGWVESDRGLSGNNYQLTTPGSSTGCKSDGHSDVNETDTGCKSDGHSDVNETDTGTSSPSPSPSPKKVSTPSKKEPQPLTSPSSGGNDGSTPTCEGPEPEPDTEPDEPNTSKPDNTDSTNDLSEYEQLFEVDDAGRFVERLAEYHGVHIQSPGALWMQVRRNAMEADEEQLRQYLDAKLADLAADGTNYNARAIQRFIRQDASDWQEVVQGSEQDDEPDRYPGQLDRDLGREDELDALFD
jgi:biotin operon repressor